ncbi:L,D-transpeptidase [Nocardioides sp. MH1]|uniref:L,D-transpeptidase n=1 Tax=Nocardioides sp. MH1 TaxID=3242490 RepID=UPI00352153EB
MTQRRAGQHRADVRPRYGRIAVLVAAVTVTGVAVLGGFGLIPSGPPDASAASHAMAPSAKTLDGGADGSSTKSGDRAKGGTEEESGEQDSLQSSTSERRSTSSTSDRALPPGSGTGRRIVFSEDAQRVWLVDASGVVQRTYLVSGSLTDNLHPGTYSVYSRSRWAVGIDDSGVMQYFVRFTQGDEGAAIGFHTIPTKDGVPLQGAAQLGTPQSHGCIRQRTSDAIALWDFAPMGTKVVVTA